MTFLPIAERELRMASRQGRTYWQRTSTALITTVVGGFMVFAFNEAGAQTGGGGAVFQGFLQIGFFYCLFGGFQNAIDCISVERREGTLGFLFLTDLKGYDVVLGKLVSTSLMSFYGLLAVFPVLAIPVLMGGVSAGQFWRGMLALLNTVFFSHAFALLLSTTSSDARNARAKGGWFIWLFVVFPIFGTLVARLGSVAGVIVQFLSPRIALDAAQFGGGRFWSGLAASHFLGWIFLAVASWLVPRVWTEKVKEPWTLRWRRWWDERIYGNYHVRTALRRQLLDINPFLWLVNRARFRKLSIWLGQLVVWVVLIGFWALLAKAGMAGRSISWLPGPSELFFVAVIFHFILEVGITREASSHFDEQRRNGGLETLLTCTPLTVEEILRGQLASLWRLFAGPVLVVLVADGIFLLLGFVEGGNFFGLSSRAVYVFGFITIISMFLAEAYALAWTGMWTGLTTRRPRQGGGEAIGRILILPWVVFGISAVFLFHFGRRWSINPSPALAFVLFAAFRLVLCVVNSTFWMRRAKRKLHNEFRAYARPNETDRPIRSLGLLGRSLGQLYGQFLRPKRALPVSKNL